MRLYERSGSLFQEGNKTWDKYMTTAKGAPRKNIDMAILAALMDSGITRLYPSVTECAKFADGAGMFSIGANWGAGIGVTCGASYPSIALAKKAAQVEMTRARDRGSELHDSVSGHLRGACVPSADLPFCKTAEHVLRHIIDAQGAVGTEVLLSGSNEMGTADVVVRDDFVCNDWKMVDGLRDLRTSEVVQVSKYCNMLGGKFQGWITLIDQNDHTKFKVHKLSPEDMHAGVRIFNVARQLWNELFRLKIASISEKRRAAAAKRVEDISGIKPNPNTNPWASVAQVGFDGPVGFDDDEVEEEDDG